jgi:hypothetical protein
MSSPGLVSSRRCVEASYDHKIIRVEVVVVEVKSTLRPRAWPRPSRREIVQLGASWLDKADNPGMAHWGLGSGDVSGAVAVVDLAASAWRCVLSADFRTALPVREEVALRDLSWLPAG